MALDDLGRNDFIVQFPQAFILKRQRIFSSKKQSRSALVRPQGECQSYRGSQLLSRPRDRSARITTEHCASPEARAGAPPPDNKRRLTKQISRCQTTRSGQRTRHDEFLLGGGHRKCCAFLLASFLKLRLIWAKLRVDLVLGDAAIFFARLDENCLPAVSQRHQAGCSRARERIEANTSFLAGRQHHRFNERPWECAGVIPAERFIGDRPDRSPVPHSIGWKAGGQSGPTSRRPALLH